MMMFLPDETDATPEEVVAAWDKGDAVWSIEMGGIGPGYEQAIQVLIVELLRDNAGRRIPSDERRSQEWGDVTVARIDADCLGFSGAQVAAAKAVAWRMLRDGYGPTLRDVPRDRLIQVSNVWPRVRPT